MFGRSGYQAVPLGDFDRFQQSSTWLNGSQRGAFSLNHTYDPLDQVRRELGAPQRWFSQVCHRAIIAFVFLLTIITFPISGWFVLKSVPTYERVIVFRLGRIRTPKGPGLVLLLPFIDHWQRVDLRTRAFSIPPCKLASQDGALVSMGADVQFRVCDPVLSIMTVNDLNMATRMTAQNVMTKILLKKCLREIQTEKLKISDQLLLEINDVTKSWGLEVDRVELILESVLQIPTDAAAVSGASQRNAICGLPGLDSTIQQLALQFFGKSLAAAGTSSKGSPDPEIKKDPDPEIKTTLHQETPSISPPGDTSTSAWGDRKSLVDSTRDEIRPQVEHVEVQSKTGPPAPTNRTVVQDIGKPFDPEEFLLIVDEYLSESLVNQIRTCYQINVLLPRGGRNTYFLDLSTGSPFESYSKNIRKSLLDQTRVHLVQHSATKETGRGRTGCGSPDQSPDVVLEMAESDLGPLVWGDLNPLNAYVCGKLRVNGDISKAMKLELLFNEMK